MNWTVWLNACLHDCKHWHVHVYRARDNFNSFLTTPHNKQFPYDMYEPVWNCRSKERVPAKGGDGPKFMCGVNMYETSTNYVYSLGSNGDMQFEDAIHERLPSMKIVTADPTLTNPTKNTVRNKHYIQFINVAVGFENITTIDGKAYPSITFEQLKQQYNPVSIVKIDIESSEHQIFRSHTSCDILNHVDQVMVEIHGTHVNHIFKWFENCDMLLYSKEPNIWGCAGYHCGEYAFISAEFAYKEYMASRGR